MSSVTFLATEWGAARGGVNALNHDLAVNCGKACKGRYPIACAVIEASEVEIQEAARNGVELISLREALGVVGFDKFTNPRIAEFLGKRPYKPAYVVGHDIFTGPCAVEAAKQIGCKSVVFIHSDYGGFKPLQTDGDGLPAREKVEQQEQVVRAADKVFGIGPSLMDVARRLDGSTTKRRARQIRNFVPGLPDIKKAHAGGTFSAAVFGRFDERNEIIKQPHLAVAAYAEFVGKTQQDASDKRITVVGLSDNDQIRREQIKKLQALVDESEEGAITLSCEKFLERPRAWEIVRRSGIVMMPSLREGFGLVGWEAIGAGVPLVVSENSGLFRFLDEHYDHLGACYWCIRVRGSYDGAVNGQDVEDLSDLLRNMHFRRDRLRIRASRLKKEILRHYHWQKRAKVFLKLIDPKAFMFGKKPRRSARVA